MTLWGRRESLHHSQLTATIDQFNPVFNSSSQIMDKYYGSLSGVLNEINNEITQQSLSISANEIFRMAAIAFILLTVWFGLRNRRLQRKALGDGKEEAIAGKTAES